MTASYALVSSRMVTVSSAPSDVNVEGPAGGAKQGDGAGVLGQQRGTELSNALSARLACDLVQEPGADSSTLVVIGHLDGEIGVARQPSRAKPVGGGDQATAVEGAEGLVVLMVDVGEVLEGGDGQVLNRCHKPQEA